MRRFDIPPNQLELRNCGQIIGGRDRTGRKESEADARKQQDSTVAMFADSTDRCHERDDPAYDVRTDFRDWSV